MSLTERRDRCLRPPTSLPGFLGVLAMATLSIGFQAASAQNRGYDRYGRDYRLHGNGFGRGTGGIYSGRRDHGRNITVYGNPFLYTPYAVAPYGYSSSFVSPGFFGGGVNPYSPYALAPGFGYSTFRSQIEYFGPSVVTVPPSPPVYVTPPLTETPVQYHVAENARDAERLRQMMRDSDPSQPHIAARPLTFRESTDEDKLKSVREEQNGDRDFQAGRYLLAYTHYKHAIDAAEDRVEPRAKLFVTYATIGQYSRAIDALKNLLQLDPNYPQRFVPLDSIYGQKRITKESTKTTVARWAAEHVANPERLLVLAALMYFDSDVDRSRQLFDKIVLYDDLAPLVQGFLPPGAKTPTGAPPQLGPDDLPALEIPDAEIDFDLPPLPQP